MSPFREADAERIRSDAETLIKVMTAPEFLEQTHWVFEAPEEERLVEASRRLSPDALRAAGLPIPEGFRVSSRYFEEGWPAAIELGDYPEGPNPINEQNAKEPGALDRLRLENPDEFWRIATEGRRPDELLLGTIFERVPGGDIAWGACVGCCTVCGGYST